VHGAAGDAQRLPGADRDGCAVDRPGEDALDAVEDLLVGVVLVGRRRQLLSAGDANLEDRRVVVGIIAREEEPDPQRADRDGLLRRLDRGRSLPHRRTLYSIIPSSRESAIGYGFHLSTRLMIIRSKGGSKGRGCGEALRRPLGCVLSRRRRTRRLRCDGESVWPSTWA
jgi:hypothetical protein